MLNYFVCFGLGIINNFNEFDLEYVILCIFRNICFIKLIILWCCFWRFFYKRIWKINYKVNVNLDFIVLRNKKYFILVNFLN